MQVVAQVRGDAKFATMSFSVKQFEDLSRYGCVLGPFVVDGVFRLLLSSLVVGVFFDVFRDTI